MKFPESCELHFGGDGEKESSVQTPLSLSVPREVDNHSRALHPGLVLIVHRNGRRMALSLCYRHRA